MKLKLKESKELPKKVINTYNYIGDIPPDLTIRLASAGLYRISTEYMRSELELNPDHIIFYRSDRYPGLHLIFNTKAETLEVHIPKLKGALNKLAFSMIKRVMDRYS